MCMFAPESLAGTVRCSSALFGLGTPQSTKLHVQHRHHADGRGAGAVGMAAGVGKPCAWPATRTPRRRSRSHSAQEVTAPILNASMPSVQRSCASGCEAARVGYFTPLRSSVTCDALIFVVDAVMVSP